MPIRACELLATLDAPTFIERCAVHTVKNVQKTKKAIRKALENQAGGRGYSFVEVLSMCPTNWGLEPPQAADWVEEAMIPVFPLGNFRDR
jgi:2-oxoglutarate ferredoxin oxidoreductase subunit beta